MQTITFYSYKGGVGRTLALANIARYLSALGNRVFAMDFDLEAPGLHHKLLEQDPPPLHPGLVDIIGLFLQTGGSPSSLEDYVIEVPGKGSSGGQIFLLPAGKAPTAEYWQELSCINWHELLHSVGEEAENPSAGLLLFLEIKALIEKEYQPDFLLIDSRTGITEIGGVATSVLADKVICLLLNNRENLEGTRAVLRALQSSQRLPSQQPVEILTVLTRIPVPKDTEPEDQIVNQVRDFLNEEAEDLIQTLSLQEVYVFHSEPDLELKEAVRVWGEKTLKESPLLADYVRFFSRLIPPEMVEQHVEILIDLALQSSRDNPDQTRRYLETLAASTASPRALEAVLKFYKLRGISGEVVLHAAYRLWDLTRDSSNPLVVESIIENWRRRDDLPNLPLSLVDEVWRKTGANNVDVGLSLAMALSEAGKQVEAQEVANLLLSAIEQEKISRPNLDKYLALLQIAGKREQLLTCLDELLQDVKGKGYGLQKIRQLRQIFVRAELTEQFDLRARETLGEMKYLFLKAL